MHYIVSEEFGSVNPFLNQFMNKTYLIQCGNKELTIKGTKQNADPVAKP